MKKERNSYVQTNNVKSHFALNNMIISTRKKINVCDTSHLKFLISSITQESMNNNDDEQLVYLC